MFRMQEITSIKEYNQFLDTLNTQGPFQKKIAIITLSFWLMSGLLTSMIDNKVLGQFSQVQQCYMCLSTILGLIIGTIDLILGPYMSLYYNRQVVIRMQSFILLLGSILLLFVPQISIISLCILTFCCYPICLCSTCILLQYISTTKIQSIIMLVLITFYLAKFVLTLCVYYFETDNVWMKILVLGMGLGFVAGAMMGHQSLRYLIDYDIVEAQKLALRIAEVNQAQDQRKVMNFIEGSFIWKKVNVKKYGFNSIFKYASLSLQTYYLGISFFCLGIFGQFPLAIFHNQNTNKSLLQASFSALWLGVFQVIGFMACIFSYKIFGRIKVSLLISIIGTILSISILILTHSCIKSLTLLSILSLLGINTFLQSILFFFMFMQAIEYYPHTIRTFTMGLAMAGYFLGHLGFMGHLIGVQDQDSAFQLVCSASLLMVFHLYRLKETFQKTIHYQIKQIQERENIQD